MRYHFICCKSQPVIDANTRAPCFLHQIVHQTKQKRNCKSLKTFDGVASVMRVIYTQRGLSTCIFELMLRSKNKLSIVSFAIKKVIEFRRFLSLENQLRIECEQQIAWDTCQSSTCFFSNYIWFSYCCCWCCCSLTFHSHTIRNTWHFIYILWIHLSVLWVVALWQQQQKNTAEKPTQN